MNNVIVRNFMGKNTNHLQVFVYNLYEDIVDTKISNKSFFKSCYVKKITSMSTRKQRYEYYIFIPYSFSFRPS